MDPAIQEFTRLGLFPEFPDQICSFLPLELHQLEKGANRTVFPKTSVERMNRLIDEVA